ncbi:DUF547 domain-containing protein [Antarcticibacterium flavum]|uniref:DUF547 domain-containing protein n=1 Tax=Antarcticibacterium flavum TaxID=2058175 RepID=A0A5B7X7F2_9FLAO|nr:DUF547 domain-containing protein [Antarcticibacterium sp. W02-3]QCY71394.1 DUF547 domain-containing protein [Antarcticibacterium flavum]
MSAQEHSRFFDLADDFFQQYTHNGQVKYAEIQQNPKALNELLAVAKKTRIPLENEAEFKAFWINAYNLATINGIVQEYPVASPMEIEGFFDKRVHSLGGKSLTLDEVEHEVLFGNFPEEARFHFVLVCAAKGCPPLLSRAYLPETLEQQLQSQTEKALNDPSFVRVQGDRVLFSEIMKWYKDDFTRGGGSLIEYVNQFRKTPVPAGREVGFFEYDWGLNGG